MYTSTENLKNEVNAQLAEREESVLAKMFDAFCQEDVPDDEETARIYESLYEELESLDGKSRDAVLYLVALLCRRHEKCGFIRGMRIEAKRKEELG